MSGKIASMIQRANVSIDRLADLRRSFVVEPTAAVLVEPKAGPDEAGTSPVQAGGSNPACPTPRPSPTNVRGNNAK